MSLPDETSVDVLPWPRGYLEAAALLHRDGFHTVGEIRAALAAGYDLQTKRGWGPKRVTALEHALLTGTAPSTVMQCPHCRRSFVPAVKS